MTVGTPTNQTLITMKSIIIFLIASAAVAVNSEILDYRLVFNGTDETKECVVAGPLCETCTSLVDCMRNGDNFTKIAAGTCTAPSKCVNGTCTTDADPFCDGTADLPFVCNEVGVFPDPFYCNKFVLCVSEGGTKKAYLNECEAGYGFDIGTGMCTVKLTKKTCTAGIYPVPLCTKLGQTGALPKNAAEYFVCTQKSVTSGQNESKEVLYPVLHQCPHGASYSNYGCGV